MIRLSFVVCLFVSQCLACGTIGPFSSSNGESDSVIGKPPPADNDPFAVISLPADATPVAHQGTIDVDETPTRQAQQEPEQEEISLQKTKVQPVTPPPTAIEKHVEQNQSACFSCVQLCAANSSAADCSDAPQDLICGWGTAPETEQAKVVARTHCNTTLDMARDMPMYSRIEGDCPPATCR